ncbi:hypothetical protein RRG08_004725 [Elysia crispata]|uniref:Uncharacterized protein n=1 Tax=Elysia crispata TaxID=231223 RepID=A0AAE0YF59_9GAST|nr:hypothetical protein RRG08_004725 [Elysia crispata]
MHITGDKNWFSIILERTSQETQTGSPSIWSAQRRAHKAGDTNWFSINLECTSQEKQIGSPSIRRAHQTGSSSIRSAHQTSSPSIWNAHQTGPPSIRRAQRRQRKLVLHQSGAHISGDTNWFSINLERTSQVTQTGSPLIWSADHR